jgi:hypothetical protein
MLVLWFHFHNNANGKEGDSVAAFTFTRSVFDAFDPPLSSNVFALWHFLFVFQCWWVGEKIRKIILYNIMIFFFRTNINNNIIVNIYIPENLECIILILTKLLFLGNL